MSSFLNRGYKFRFILAAVLLALIIYMFWTSSRYPSLGDKALMSGSIQLEDPLSFVARFPVDPNFPIWKKIGLTTINWLDTNRQGMTFGVLLGAAFLTILRYIKPISFKGPFANSLLGLAIGTPMGVCVNCAAPIAKGLYAGGARAETTLSTMIASPTMNIVVLTMLFSILPFYMAVTKIALSIAVILIAVPIICKFLPRPQLQVPEEQRRVCPMPKPEQKPETITEAIKGFAKDIGTDFWYIFRLTVPLMILAGFLGAMVATLAPIESLGTLKYGLIGLCIIALVGTFLPVPIAFDVVICGALLAAGLPVGYVMTLLFTLGIFSIYSFFIVSQTISFRAAALTFTAVIFLGIISGASVHAWHKHQFKQALKILTQEATGMNTGQNDLLAQTAQPKSSGAMSTTPSNNQPNFDITITRKDFTPRSPKDETLFTRREAHHIGIDHPIEFSFKDMWPPYWEGRSIAAGDIDKDGDMDIVIASTENGLYLYENDGTGQFTVQKMAAPQISNYDIFNAVLVDINNDGWLDLFIASYGTGNFVVLNKRGKFDTSTPIQVLNRKDARLSLALSFGDVDKDGDLDIALGNWAAGWYRRIPGEESRNRIVYNQNGILSGQSFKDLPGLPGETLSILLSDINADGSLDLLVGNDFELPDVYYYGVGNGDFVRISPADKAIPHTTTTTMAIKTHDLDNDLIPEIYLAQIAGRSSGVSERLNMQPIEKYCDGIERAGDRKICQTNMQIKTWYKSGNNFDPSYAGKCLEFDDKYQAECKAMLVKDLAIQAEDPSLCNLIAPTQIEAKAYCTIHFKPSRPLTPKDIADNYKQIKGRNVLLSRTQSGAYKDNAIVAGLDVGGWSWDTKIADFNNDEWPDLLIVNGTWVPNEVTPSNMFFLNDGHGKFSQQARISGLEDFLITAAATHVDIDNDGDLDVLTVPINGPVQAFINNSQAGHSIGFSFEDEIGNHFGVGNKLTIIYGPQSTRRQIREIQLGGGFQSFDAPYIHFGLGKHDTVQKVIIDWADGGQSVLQKPLSAGAKYIIGRNQN